ncbi:acyltransferase [Nonomuraea sp. NPDC059007]|uniref:acyltransferase family protein n=1 Tax=Nonomuraea sp. NPDC059007 TaxID=3346692 RepID=UPI0036C6893A
MTITAERLHYLDRVRVLLTVLVVLHHVALTYGSFDLWYYHEPSMGKPSPPGEWDRLLDLFLLLNQTYFMGLFFLISAYLVPGSYDRKGGRRFLTDRVIRLGIPLILLVFAVVPLAKLPLYRWENARAPVPYLDFYLRELEQGPGWFLVTLMIFVAAYAVIRALRPAPPPRPATRLRARTVIGFAALLAVLGVLWRVLPLERVPVVQFPVPDYLPQYICMFTAGVIAYRRGWLAAIPARATGWGFAAAAVAALPLLPVALGGTALIAQVAHGLFDGVYCVGMSLGMLGLFSRRFTAAPGPLGRFMSAHAYAVYVLHASVLVVVSVALSGLPAGALVKFALAAVLSLPLCWMVAAAVRALPMVRRVL